MKTAKTWQVGYLKINLGLTIKEAADRLGLNYHTADWHWQRAKEKIRSFNRGRL